MTQEKAFQVSINFTFPHDMTHELYDRFAIKGIKTVPPEITRIFEEKLINEFKRIDKSFWVTST